MKHFCFNRSFSLLSVIFLSGLSLSAYANFDKCAYPIKSQNQKFVDNCNRTVILRGVNLVNKQKPYTASAINFGENDIKLIKSGGFNVVRLGFAWVAIEPNPGQYNDAYIANMKKTIQQLAKHNIYTIVDFHQDSYGDKHNGFGFPQWAALGSGKFKTYGFPADYYCGYKIPISNVTINPQVCQDWDGFWQNKPINSTSQKGVQDHYMDMLKHVASKLNDTKGILGYELINEPYIGSNWRQCYKNPKLPVNASQGCQDFDKNYLMPFIQKGITAIRSGAPGAMVLYEPHVLFYSNSQTHIGKLGASNLAFSFHDYNDNKPQIPINNMHSQVVLNNAAPIVTEYGADQLNADKINKFLGLFDQNQLSSVYWAYYNNPAFKITSIPIISKYILHVPKDPRNQGLIQRMSSPQLNSDQQKIWNALVRPYPQYVDGKINSFSFDPKTKDFVLTYIPSAGRNGETQIYIPKIHYPNGYDVNIKPNTDTTIKTSKNDGQVVMIKTKQKKPVTITIQPKK